MSFDANDIRYVALSDLHFGEEDSVLTRLRDDAFLCDATRPSDVLVELVLCLRHLIEQNRGDRKPTLVLNGDVLDLAFSTFGQSLMIFERFVELTLAPGQELFEDVIYLPGNHDHHLWEMARERDYVYRVLRDHHEGRIPEPQHTSGLFWEDAVPSPVLEQMVHRVRGTELGPDPDHPVRILYPNFGVVSEDKQRAVIFHHGHYLETRYWLVSKLRDWLNPQEAGPITIDQLEAENFAWIDFVWSVLGRSGAAGSEAESVYKRLKFPKLLEEFSDDLAARIAASVDIPYVPGEWLERRVLKLIFSKLSKHVSGVERCHDAESLSSQIETGVSNYLFGPTFQQLRDVVGHVPSRIAFVFGHTHKPFERTIRSPDGDTRIELVNTGGWTVDGVDAHTVKGGAVALVSNSLEVASLRFYNESESGEFGPVRVAPADPQVDAAVAFGEEIERRMGNATANAAAGVWRRFPRTVERAVATRRRYIAEKFSS